VAVPATAPPAPDAAQAVRLRSENTRPRLNRCSAHRVRPQRPHRPRSRPVFGPPLRQLASDPFHPVEGGSANDYDYCSGDPVNCTDLDGTKQRKLTPEEQERVDKIAGECRSGADAYYSGSSFCTGFLRGLGKGDLTDYGFGFVPNKPTSLATAAKRCVQGAAVEGAIGAIVGAGTGAAYGAGFGMIAAPGPGGLAGAGAGAATGAARGFLTGAGSGCAVAAATHQRLAERVPR
jgi:hypothetical protein